MEDNTDILLARYFSGEATPQELEQLDHWLSESQENEKHFEEMTLLFQETALRHSLLEPDKERALSRFRDYMNSGERKEKKGYRIPAVISGIAASFLLLAGLFFLYRYTTKEILLTAEQEPVYHIIGHTEIRLAPGGRLKYGNKKTDPIELQGDARFDVRAGNQSLLVKAGDTYIEDIGTVFSVYAGAKDETVVVEVEEGAVRFFTRSLSGILVHEGERGIYEPHSRQFYREKIPVALEEGLPESPIPDLAPATGPDMQEEDKAPSPSLSGNPGEMDLMPAENSVREASTQEMKFNAVALEHVLDEIAMRFNVRFVFADSSLKKLLITVSFDKDESLDKIVAIIAETLSIHITKSRDGYTVSY